VNVRETNLRLVVLAVFVLALPLSLFGQTATQDDPPPSTPQSNPAPEQNSNNKLPCWQQAGISKAVIEQYHAIERDTHSQVAAVCENSALNPRQKQIQVRQIRQQARQKIEALAPPQQESAFRSCQQQRHAGMPKDLGVGNGGPCGNFETNPARENPPTSGKAPGSTPQQPSVDSAPQN
jgi:hypothetical protein